MTEGGTENKSGNGQKSPKAAARDARLKQALRDNLKRRKAQARVRKNNDRAAGSQGKG